MKIKYSKNHLTYCTNIHINTNWEESLHNLNRYTISIKKSIAPNKEFGIGLCLSNTIVDNLITAQNITLFKNWLVFNNMYVLTLNGFVYKHFHKKNIKENIYKPDWSTEERLLYTKKLIHLFSNIITKKNGSISTVPICYKKTMDNYKERYRILQKSIINLMEITKLLVTISKEKKINLYLCLEPEPDCFLENTNDILNFYNHYLIPYGSEYLNKNYKYPINYAKKQICKYIQICYDVCHFAIQYEKPEETFTTLRKNKITIGKIQLSSLLNIQTPKNKKIKFKKTKQLHIYSKTQFLHQTRTHDKTKNQINYPDLLKIIDIKHITDVKKYNWRIHYHIPLYRKTYNAYNTSQEYIKKVIQQLDPKKEHHLEIETYTWEALHKKQNIDVVGSIVKEYTYILNIYNR